MALYSAMVSGVTVSFDSLSSSSDHFMGLFFQVLVLRDMPRAMSSALSYWTVMLAPP